MSETAASFVAKFAELSPTDQQKVADASGLFEGLDRKTRRMIWAAVFGVLGLIAIAAFVVIIWSWNVDTVTTTGAGDKRVVTTTHPDVSAAYAIVSAVVAGIVGLLVPSPTKSNGGS